MHVFRNSSKLGIRPISTPKQFGPEVISVNIDRKGDPEQEQTQRKEHLERSLRVSHASEAVTYAFMKGQEWTLRGRLDAKHFLELAQNSVAKMDTLRQEHDSKSSSLLPVLQPIGFMTGALIALAPTTTQHAVHGAIQDSLIDTYNDQIRAMIEDGTLDRHPKLKATYLALRDYDRMPSGAIPPPDLSRLQKIEELSVTDGIGAVVKGICNLSTKLIGKVKF